MNIKIIFTILFLLIALFTNAFADAYSDICDEVYGYHYDSLTITCETIEKAEAYIKHPLQGGVSVTILKVNERYTVEKAESFRNVREFAYNRLYSYSELNYSYSYFVGNPIKSDSSRIALPLTVKP